MLNIELVPQPPVHHSAVNQPTAPSKLTLRSFCASTANSIGSSLKTSLQKPFTIIETASSSEIPGVNNMYFLKAALNAVRASRGLDPLDAMDFLGLVKEKQNVLQVDETLLQRAVNVGFSGGEKKRNEIFQMAMMEPRLAILDETDSGLDIDALKHVAHGINAVRDPQRAIIIITHYQRLLNYVTPNYVHVLSAGRIVKSGDRELALHLEEQGYSWVREQATDA